MKNKFWMNMANAIKKAMGIEPDEEQMKSIVSAVTKSTAVYESEIMTKAMGESLKSILKDDSIEEEEKERMLEKSLCEFSNELQKAVQRWEEEVPELEPEGSKPEDSEYKNSKKSCKTNTIKQLEQEGNGMDITKMSPEDKAAYEELKKKYSQEENHQHEVHPEVQKALDEASKARSELEELKKSVEIGKFESVAKKYEIIGKNAEVLAPKLYEMKKADETAYNDYVAVLDEMVKMSEATGLFKEFGSNHAGSGTMVAKMDAIVAQLMKADPQMTYAQAVVKACDDNPDLKKAYE